MSAQPQVRRLGIDILADDGLPAAVIGMTACAMVGEVGAGFFQEFLGQGQRIAEPPVFDRDREVSQLPGDKDFQSRSARLWR